MNTQQTVSAHLYLIEDNNGDIVDAIVFCSDECHRDWCQTLERKYLGWNGCNEMDSPQWCACCNDKL